MANLLTLNFFRFFFTLTHMGSLTPLADAEWRRRNRKIIMCGRIIVYKIRLKWSWKIEECKGTRTLQALQGKRVNLNTLYK